MRKLLRILGLILLVFAAVPLLLALSLPIDAALGAGRVAALTNTDIAGPAGNLRAYVARPTAPGPHPAVIMVHEWWGLRPEIVEKADALAAQGFVVIAPDTFRGSSTGWIPRAIYQVATTPAAQINADLDAVFAWLTTQPDVAAERVAVIGFCYGGRAALSYTVHNPTIAATAVFYGMTEFSQEQLATIRGPVLGIWGGADTSIPLTEVARLEDDLRSAGVTVDFHIFDGQPHAFVGGIAQIRAGGAPAEAWQLLEQFLGSALGAGTSGAAPAPAAAQPPLPAPLPAPLAALHHWFVCELPS
jgi:carboxymethylenebutenolidase